MKATAIPQTKTSAAAKAPMQAAPVQTSRPTSQLARLAQTKPDTPGLPTGLRAAVERLSGVSLHGTRVHLGSAAPRAIGARAFARGHDIHIAPGETASLPHELWHITQQRQGRVRPSGQLPGGAPLNDAADLEREARVMGARAMAQRGQTAPSEVAPSTPAASNILQPDWYWDGTQMVWYNTGDVIPPGTVPRQPVNTSYGPHTLHAYSHGYTYIDSTTHQSFKGLKKSQKAPNNDDLKKRGTAVGAEMAHRSNTLSDHELASQIVALNILIERIEAIAGPSVPYKHATKVAKMYHTKGFTNKQYRTMTGGEDELLRSSTAAAIFNGYRDHVTKHATGTSTAATKRRDLLHAHGIAMMQLASAMRTPTMHVVAPVTGKDGITPEGVRHPTGKGVSPKLHGGTSAHNLNDPLRAHHALSTYESLQHDAGAPPHALFLSMLVAAAAGTLNHMMFPLAAENITDYHAPLDAGQAASRGRVKAMGSALARVLGIGVSRGVQMHDAPTRSNQAPASPLRVSPPEFTERRKRTRSILQSTCAALGPAAQHDSKLAKVRAIAKTADPDARKDQAALVDGSLALRKWVLTHPAPVLRAMIPPAQTGHPAAPGGLRERALQQFFLECGQMAAHNALVMAGIPHADSEAGLNTLGPLDNNIHEDTIREMLNTAGHPTIPVVGNMAEMHALIGLLEAGDMDALRIFRQNAVQQQGLATLNDFARERTDELVAVVNTTGHLGPRAQGEHWIAVHLTRTAPNGPITVRYRDSYNGPQDYSAMLAGLKNALK